MQKEYRAVVIGVSSGGMNALKCIFQDLPKELPIPIIVVQHLNPHSDNYITKYLDDICALKVKEAEEKEKLNPSTIYFAPPNYHLLIEKDETLSLSVDEKVNYARPSIDVLFDSASDAFGSYLIGIILTGANNDGSVGLKHIKEQGGLTIVQNPNTAEVGSMPQAAINKVKVDYILNLNDITKKLIDLIGDKYDK